MTPRQQPDPDRPAAPDAADAEGSTDGGVAVCAQCGARAPGPPPTWTLSVENGSRRHYCVGCARANLRAIEGRLDPAWW
ncbi:hypothetical protein ACIP93_05960 [Streptomyces sp. NPDC088745]|uniref:hypothetical protein n=1 Tax=Streptomyces sp. NPDC088745 TaxID=3365884 RepID=UPI00381EC891